MWGTSPSSSNALRRLAFELLTKIIGARLQEDRLWIADPKAINHILQKSGYLYAKPGNTQERIALLSDRGIISVEGEFCVPGSRFLPLACLISHRRCAQAS